LEGLLVKQQTVLIISDDATFARELAVCWQKERTAPAFAMVTSDLWQGNGSTSCDLAVVGPLSGEKTESVLHSLNAAGVDALAVISSDAEHERLRRDFPWVPSVDRSEQGLALAVLLGAEVLRRVAADAHAKRADHAMNLMLRQAALGRYMLESRHSFNNALTSVLGNAELMLLESESFSENTKEQVNTVLAMALRLHEMMQRFSSLEQEMTFGDRQSQVEINGRAHAYVSGT